MHGRLATVETTKLNGLTVAPPLVTTYEYDDSGNLERETLPNGVTTQYGYDGLNRLRTLDTKTSSQTPLLSQAYELNSDGTRIQLTEAVRQPGGDFPLSVTTWTYDALGRLTGESVQGSYADSFEYDLASNRVRKVHTGPGAGPDETITYEYSANDQLDRQVSSTSGVTTFEYDDNGSLIRQVAGTDETTYTYDVRNRMATVAVNGIEQAAYGYDHQRNRVAETVDGEKTLFLVDEQNPTGYAQPLEIRPYDQGGPAAPTTTHLLGQRMFGQIGTTGGTLRFLHADGHGSTRLLSDAAATVAAAFGYDAFGSPLGFDPAAAGTIYLFGGDGVYDAASGLTLHGNGVRARSGFLFLQRDRYAGDRQDPLSLHKYLYAHANPVTYTDPSGYSVLGFLGGAAVWAGENAIDFGRAAMATGAVGFVASLATYYGATLGLAVASATGDIAGMGDCMRLRGYAIRGMYMSGLLFGGGALAYIAGAVLVSAGVALAAAGTANPWSGIGSTGKVGEDALKQLGGQSQVPLSTSLGVRCIDQFVAGVAHEAKVGYQTLGGDIPRQIAKDFDLLSNGRVDGVVWHFFRSPVTGQCGPSQPLYDALMNAGIIVVTH